MAGGCVQHIIQLIAGAVSHRFHYNSLLHAHCLVKFHHQVVKSPLGHCVIGMPQHYHHRLSVIFLFSICGHAAAKPQNSGHDSRQHMYT